MKLFYFYRTEDASGVSGTGPVVEGVQFTNGWCALRWVSKHSSICFYRSLDDVKAIHGHGGKTEIIVEDFEPVERRRSEVSEGRFELLLEVIEESSRVMTFADDPELIGDARASVRKIRGLLDKLEASLGVRVKRTA